MDSDVNQRIPADARRSPGWYPSKWRWLWNLHREFYPDSKKRTILVVLTIVVFVLVLGFLRS
jgi:hypothetical protein